MNWHKMNHPVLREEATGEGDAGGGSAPALTPSTAIFATGGNDDPLKRGHNFVKPGEGAAEPAEAAVEPQAAAAAAPVTPPPNTAITPEMLSQIVRESVALAGQSQNAPATTAAPAQQLSDEQFKQFFKVPHIDNNRFRSVFGVEPESPAQLKALNDLFSDAMFAAARMAVYQNKSHIEQVQQQYAPLKQTIEQQQHEREESEFFNKNLHLKPHKDLLLAVRAQALQQGMKFPSVAAAQNYLVKTTDAILAKVRGGSNTTAGQQTPVNGSPKLTTTNVGGQSSHGRGGAPNGAKSPAERSIAIFKTGTR